MPLRLLDPPRFTDELESNTLPLDCGDASQIDEQLATWPRQRRPSTDTKASSLTSARRHTSTGIADSDSNSAPTLFRRRADVGFDSRDAPLRINDRGSWALTFPVCAFFPAKLAPLPSGTRLGQTSGRRLARPPRAAATLRCQLPDAG